MRIIAIVSLFALPALLGAQTAPVLPQITAPKPNLVQRAPTREEMQSMAWTVQNSNQLRVNVDGEIITQFDVRKGVSLLLPRIRQESRTQEEFEQKINAMAVETRQRLTDQKLLLQEFKESGASVPASYITAKIDEKIQRNHNGDRSEYLSVLKRLGITPLEDRQMTEENMILEYMFGKMSRPASEISPQKIQDYYAENKAEFVRSEMIKFRQITLTPGAAETDDDIHKQAQVIINELKQGRSFEELARRYSKDDLRNEGGGGSQWRDVSSINEKIIAALKALTNEGVTEPMDFTVPGARVNIFIFQRVDYRPGGVAPIEEVQDAIAQKLREREERFAQEDWLTRLRSKYFVRYY